MAPPPLLRGVVLALSLSRRWHVGAYTRYHDRDHKFIPAACMCENLRCDEFLTKLRGDGVDAYTFSTLHAQNWWQQHYRPAPEETECETLFHGWDCDCSRCPVLPDLCACAVNLTSLPPGSTLSCPANTTRMRDDGHLIIEGGASCQPQCPNQTTSSEAMVTCQFGRLVEQTFECRDEDNTPAPVSLKFVDSHVAQGVISGPVQVELMPANYTINLRAYLGTQEAPVSFVAEASVPRGRTSAIVWLPVTATGNSTELMVFAGDHAHQGASLTVALLDIVIESAAQSSVVRLENLNRPARLSLNGTCGAALIGSSVGLGTSTFELYAYGEVTVCACPEEPCELDANYTDVLGRFLATDVGIQRNISSTTVQAFSPLALSVDGVDPANSRIYAGPSHVPCDSFGEGLIEFALSNASLSLWHATIPAAGEASLCWAGSWHLSIGDESSIVVREGPMAIGSLSVTACSPSCSSCHTEAGLCTTCTASDGLCAAWPVPPAEDICDHDPSSGGAGQQEDACPASVVEVILDDLHGAPADVFPELLPEHFTSTDPGQTVTGESTGMHQHLISSVTAIEMLGSTALLVLDTGFDSPYMCPQSYVFDYFAQGALFLFNLSTGRADFACPHCCGLFRDPRSVRVVPSGVAWLVADAKLNLVLRIDGVTREMTVFAGTKIPHRNVSVTFQYDPIANLALNPVDQPRPAMVGTSRRGDGGPAIQSTLCKPVALAPLSVGGMLTLIAEGNCFGDGVQYVRVVDEKGIINTVAQVRGCPAEIDTIEWLPGSDQSFFITCGELRLCSMSRGASVEEACSAPVLTPGIVFSAQVLPNGRVALAMQVSEADSLEPQTVITIYANMSAITQHAPGCRIAGGGSFSLGAASVGQRLQYRVWGDDAKLFSTITVLRAAPDGTIFFVGSNMGVGQQAFRLRPPCGKGRGADSLGMCGGCAPGSYQSGSKEMRDVCQVCTVGSSKACEDHCYYFSDSATVSTNTGLLEVESELQLCYPLEQLGSAPYPCPYRFGYLPTGPGDEDCAPCAEGQWCTGHSAVGKESSHTRMRNGYWFDADSKAPYRCNKDTYCWWTPHHLFWHAYAVCENTTFSDVSLQEHCAGAQVGGRPGSCPSGRSGPTCAKCDAGTFAPTSGAPCMACGRMWLRAVLYLVVIVLALVGMCVLVKALDGSKVSMLFGAFSALGALIGFLDRMRVLYAHSSVRSPSVTHVWPYINGVDLVGCFELLQFIVFPFSTQCLVGEDLVQRRAFLALAPLPVVALIAWSTCGLPQWATAIGGSKCCRRCRRAGASDEASDNDPNDLAVSVSDGAADTGVDARSAGQPHRSSVASSMSSDPDTANRASLTAFADWLKSEDNTCKANMMVLSEVCQVMVGMLLYPVVDYVFNFFQCYRHVEVDGEALSSLLWSPDVLCGSEEWLHAMPFAAVGVCYLAAWIVLQVRMAMWMRAHHLFDQWKDPKFEEEMRRSTGSNGQEGATTGRNESGNAVEDSVEKTLSFASIRDSVAKVPSIGSVRDSIRSSESVGSARTAFESLIAGVALPPRQQQLYRFRFGLHWWDLATTVRAVLFHSVMTCDFFPDDMKTFLVLLLTIGGAVNVACLQPNVYWCVNILEISTEFATLAMIFLYRKIQRSVLESDEDHEEQSLKHDGYASTALYMLVAFFACYVLSRALWMVYHQEASDRADKRDADTFADRLCRLAMRVAHANPQALQREMEKLDEYSLREVVRSLDSIEQVLSPESLQETMRRSRLSAFDWRTKPMNEELETAFDVVRGSSHRASRSTASSGASSGVLGLPSFRSSVRSAASALMQPDGASLGAAGGATPAGTSQGGAGDAAPAETMRGAAEDAGASPVSAEEEEGATEAAGIPGDEDCTPPPGEGLSLQGAARGREVPRDAADAGASGEAEENSEIIDRI